MSDESYKPTERRPLTSRSSSVFQRIAAWLVERNVSPNAISVASIGFSLVACLCLLGTSMVEVTNARLLFALGAVFIQAKLLANLLDGMVAVDSGQASPLGEIYNEVPDRISDPLIFIGAGYAAAGSPSLGFLAAVLSLFVAYVRVLGNSIGAQDLFHGPMAKPHRMATLTAACVYSTCVPVDWFGGIASGVGSGAASIALLLIVVGSVITAVRRLRSISVQLRENA